MRKNRKHPIVCILIVFLTCAFGKKDGINCNDFHTLLGQNLLTRHVDRYVEKIVANYTGNIHKYQNDCNRPCKENDQRICYHNFFLEHYQAMGVACRNCANGNIVDCFNDQCVMAVGVERGVKSVNRMVPGPHIQVCVNDVVVVDIMNTMIGNEASIHWHGILQAGTPFMDGVPYVTQCPIHFNNLFRYSFIADNVGTYFWHAHAGHQKADGQHGALTIRGPPKTEPNSHLYDFDDIHILIADWQKDEMGTMYDPGLPTRQPGLNPDTILINGRGKYFAPITGTETVTPYALFHFQTGKRYRMRFVNSGSHACPVQVQIQDHELTVIATDGSSVKPRDLNSFLIYAGERYDFVVKATKPSGMYWIHFKAIGPCRFTRIYQLAMIVYNQDPALKWMNPTQPKPDYDGYPDGKILNHPNISDTSENIIKVEQLEAYDIDKRVLKETDVKIVIAFSNRLVTYDQVFNSDDWFRFLNVGSSVNVVGTMDGIQSSFPPSPYLTQPTDGSNFCWEENLPSRCRNDSFCDCNHVVKIKKGMIVEMMLVDESTAVNLINHPIHLHGFKFYVTELGQGFENGVRVTKAKVLQMDKEGHKFTKVVESAPLKDTISVPSYGYAVIKFIANNPAMTLHFHINYVEPMTLHFHINYVERYWAMHCHFDIHMLVGMIMTFQVGENRDNPWPPRNFPKCGDFPLQHNLGSRL